MTSFQRPSILLIYTDQQRWDALGANGNADIHTPNLDALATEGVNFDHYFVHCPVCMPSRVSMLTGRYPSSLDITHMGVPVPETLQTAAHVFSGAGYRTANLGKLHFLPHANRDHREPHPPYGFSHLEISDEPGVYEDAYRAWVRARDPAQLPHLSVGLPPARQVWLETMTLHDAVPHPASGSRLDFEGPIPFPGEDGYTHSAFVADRTKSFLEQATEPFFCVAGFYSPHAPWVVPQRFLDLYEPENFTLSELPTNAQDTPSTDELRRARHGYYAMVSEVDHYVGEIVATLEHRGLSDNTVVVFTSDHGEWLGLRGKYGKGYPGDDAVTRVPLVVHWPNGIKDAGRTVSGLVEAVDILPSLLEAAALQIPPAVQGKSLLGVLQGTATPEKTSALTEYAGWKALRTARYRYLIHADGTEKLWDLDDDPQEYRDVAGFPTYQEVLAEHRRLLLARLVSQERLRARTWPY